MPPDDLKLAEHDYREIFRKIHEALHRLEVALTGDTVMGNPGIVVRLDSIEKQVKTQIEDYKRERWTWSGVVVGLTLASNLLWEKIKG